MGGFVMPKNSRISASLLLTVLLVLSSISPALAVISFEGSTSHAARTHSLTMDRPAGVAEGDILLAQITFYGGQNITVQAPSGWHLVRCDNLGSKLGQALYYKVATPSEPASYTWQFFDGSKLKEIYSAGSILLYKGVDTDNPILAHNGQASPKNTVGPIAPSVTASIDSTLVTFFGVEKNFGLNALSGIALRMQRRSVDADISILASDEQVGPGITGPRQATWSTTDTADYIGQSVLLKNTYTVSTSANPTAGLNGLSTAALQLFFSITPHSPYAWSRNSSIQGLPEITEDILQQRWEWIMYENTS